MIINHNMPSINTNRQLGINNFNTAKSLEKLSSGLRINKAGDDAAGLAISEKMRGQIRGLDQAARNSQDAISMISTAEGSLSETHSILQRMKELATQAANDTNVGVDRNEIQKEINQLTSEINRIGNTTEFNTQKLLNGGGVDPTSTTSVSSNGLTVAASLAGGSGITNALGTAANRATATVQLAAIPAAGGGGPTSEDGKYFTVNFGSKEVKVIYDSTATASGVSGDTITIKTTAAETAANLATDITNQLTAYINANDTLKGNYTAANGGTDTITVQAAAVTMTASGEIKGLLNGGTATIANGSSAITAGVGGFVNSGSKGTHASQTIDFTNTTADQLKNSEIVIDGKHIAFYDSADGKYSGSADFAIDLNGARTPEKIVDTIVGALAGTAGAAVKASVSGTDVFDAQNSALDNVYLTKVNSTKLQITAQQSGQSGDLIKMGNNAAVTVTQTYDNARLANESVVSAKGLADGEQKVTLTNVAAAVENQVTSANGTEAATITVADTNTSGTYKVDFTAAATAQLQKYNTSTNAWDSVGSAFDATTTGATTINGITIDVTSAFADGDSLSFEIDGNHFEATLTEAGSTSAGTTVRINNGQQNVELVAQDGIGSAVVNVGAWDAAKFSVGESISWSFETKTAPQSSTDVVGGKFEATFQIGANMGQSMSIEINDMRSQSLLVSGTSASGKASVDGAVFTATKDVSNGTDNAGVEYALDVSTYGKATAAIKVINNAIEKVSAERSKLGAYTNRLEHTITNLGTASENTTAAESRIRDVDMAKEMMQFQKNNILSQAAQAMLAQANQQPQGVLQLLR